MVMQKGQQSLRSQRILEHLTSVWQRQEGVSPDAVTHILELVVNLPEEHRAAGLQTVAREVVSSMHMHMLALVETFQQKADQEGIRAKHRDQTLEHVLPEIFDVIKKTEGKIIVHSLDDLAALMNITASLLLGSQTDSAEEAQTWLYELPSLYYNRLVREKLVVGTQAESGFWSRPPSQFNWLMHGLVGWSEPYMELPTKKVSDIPHHPVAIDLRLTCSTQHA